MTLRCLIALALRRHRITAGRSGLSRFVSKAPEFVTKQGFSAFRHTVLKLRKARRKRAKFASSHRTLIRSVSKRNLIAAFGPVARVTAVTHNAPWSAYEFDAGVTAILEFESGAVCTYQLTHQATVSDFSWSEM